MKPTLITANPKRPILFLLIIFLLFPVLNVRAQWTTSGNDIKNTNTGNVGIGTDTTAPLYKLNVANSVDKAQIRFGMGALDSGGFLFSNAPGHAVFSGGVGWDGAWKAKSMSASLVQLNLGAISFFADNGLTVGNTIIPTERMRITSSGYVGIGTTVPTSKLHMVSGTDNGTTLLSLDTGTHGGTSMAVFGTANNESGFDLSVFRAGQYYSRIGVSTTGDLYLQPAGNNVGIGTSTPLQRLQIGTNTATATATPDSISLGGTYSNTAGANAKLRLFDDNAGNIYGVGTSLGQFDFIVPSSARYVWNLGGVEKMRLDSNGTVGIATTTPNSLYKLDVNGKIRSSSGGFVFPDGTTQLTAATGGGGTITGVTAGTGLTGGGTSGSVTVTNNDKGSDQSIFKNVANAAGTTQFSASQNSDTIRFEGVGGTTVTFTNGAFKKITIDGSTSNVSAANIPAGQFGQNTGGGNYTFPGNVTVTGNIAAKYQDVAEWVDSSQELPPGTVVVLDSTKTNQVIASTQPYDSRIAGVISTRPGLVLGQEGAGRVLVATTGRVRVKVDASSGPIQIGDLLVTSNREGFAMRSTPVDVGGVAIHRPGTLIGKALEPWTTGQGEILVLLSLQ